MRAVIDSGSSLTMIQASAAHKLVQQGSAIEPGEKMIKTVTGSGKKIETKIKIRISTIEDEMEVYAYIIPTSGFSGQLLVGSDVLGKTTRNH